MATPAPPRMPRNPRKHATGKIRTSWSNRNHRFNPIKRRLTTMDTKVSDLNKVNIVAPTLGKACNGFSSSCSYCKQDAPHPMPQNSDWLSKDWDGIKAKIREQSKSLIDFNDPKPRQTQNRLWA